MKIRVYTVLLGLLFFIMIVTFCHPILGELNEQTGLGCCIDTEEFLHNKYQERSCLSKGGKFTLGECENMQQCKTLEKKE